MKIVVFALSFFFFTLALANNGVDDLQHHASQLVLKGRVNCVDCARDSDLSGVKVSAKCDKLKKLSITYTREDGTFETYLPSDNNPKLLTTPLNCKAKIMGGPHQLYALTKDSIISVTKSKDLSHYETLKPLYFYEFCPVRPKLCGGKDKGFESSKTVDLPLPKEWGLAPSSYYVNPFLPIIGIP